ncbi:MAG: Fic family protein [Thermoleophilaceae bacterium]|nr:Fic family protein [Thermoleophilaceae bacterium]
MDLEPAEGESVYLELVDALELYAAIIGGTATQAADQLRDAALLESALGRLRAYAHYEDADLALQAAVLANGIAESQTFIDGNKRLALVAMLTFLEVSSGSGLRLRPHGPRRRPGRDSPSQCFLGVWMSNP